MLGKVIVINTELVTTERIDSEARVQVDSVWLSNPVEVNNEKEREDEEKRVYSLGPGTWGHLWDEDHLQEHFGEQHGRSSCSVVGR